MPGPPPRRRRSRRRPDLARASGRVRRRTPGGRRPHPWLYARRRAALETLFADTPLTAPFTLCPSTTDSATARDWLTWTSGGLEELCFKPLRARNTMMLGVPGWS
ncbi:hypothetical protein R2F25_00115 [Streptomyces sp. UP1A-1]|nr:hypothetical protein [Streptomyces sp. UP1A-1]